MIPRFYPKPPGFTRGKSRFFSTKAAVFGGFDVLTPRLLLIGCLLGACMIPGTYFARWLILRTPLHVHVIAMEVIVVLGACSFLWRAFAG